MGNGDCKILFKIHFFSLDYKFNNRLIWVLGFRLGCVGEACKEEWTGYGYIHVL